MQKHHETGANVETRTARKPVQIQPTVIRLNRVSREYIHILC